jgi:hypothetical protein
LTYKGKSTVTTHTVTSDTDAAGVELGELGEDGLGQFLGDVAVHIVACVIRGLCSVDVEASAGAEVISIILAFDVKTACGKS